MTLKVTVVTPALVEVEVGTQAGAATATFSAMKDPISAAKPKPQTIALRLAARGFKNCVDIHL
jgi:hypothetical protein